MERGKRIELSASAWKAEVLPLYEPRMLTQLGGYWPLNMYYTLTFFSCQLAYNQIPLYILLLYELVTD